MINRWSECFEGLLNVDNRTEERSTEVRLNEGNGTLLENGDFVLICSLAESLE